MRFESPTPEQIPALRGLWQEAFGDSDAFLDTFLRTAFSAARCRCAVWEAADDAPRTGKDKTVSGADAAHTGDSASRADAAHTGDSASGADIAHAEHSSNTANSRGMVVGALYWLDCLHEGRRLAYLYAVATARSHRGRGICRRLMEDTHRHLTALGYAGVLLVPGEASLFEFYRRMGYRVCGGVREWSCTAADPAELSGCGDPRREAGQIPPGETVPQECCGDPRRVAGRLQLRKIDAVEYAALRRRFLPPGGVVQEGENLAFLQTMAAYYAGEGVLLAARVEGDTLHGIELLGEASAAPRLVRDFGCREGHFRGVGGERPFAMFLSLCGDAISLPTYFGLAFD